MAIPTERNQALRDIQSAIDNALKLTDNALQATWWDDEDIMRLSQVHLKLTEAELWLTKLW